MLVRCINCGFPCQKYGKTSAGTQRWYCTACHISFVNKIDNTTKQLKEFPTWGDAIVWGDYDKSFSTNWD